MKKFTIIFLLLMLIGIATADVYTIGTGTSTQSYIPFYGLYDYGWSKVIYTATELSAAGLTAGPIDGLGFEVGNTPSNYVAVDQRMYIRHTAVAEYEATDNTLPDNTAFQNIYYADYTWNGGGWHYIMFSSAFNWDGTSNIEISYENWDGAYASGPTFKYTTTSPAYLAVYKYADTTFPGTLTGSRTYNRPNLQIVTPSTTAPNPAVLVGPADGSTLSAPQANLSWAPGTGGLPTGYKLYLGTTNPPAFQEDLGAVASHTTRVLPFGTTHYWQIVPYNAIDDAAGCPVWSFTSMPDPTLYPGFVEDFGTVSGDWPVANWTQLNGLYPTPTGTTSQWFRDEWLNGPTGNNAARINIYGTSRNGWLVTPPIAIPATGYELMFDLGLTDDANSDPIEDLTAQQDDKFIVIISDSPDMSNPTILKEWNNSGSPDVYNDIPNTGTMVIIDLDAYPGTKYIAFYGESTVTSNGDNDLFVDNVSVRESPLNPIISVSPDAWDYETQLINTTTPQEFTITNTGAGSLNVSSINVTGTGFALAGAFTPMALLTGESASFTVNFAPVAEGTYSGNIAINSNIPQVNITLDGAAIDATIYAGDLPHFENFDAVTAPDLPLGWTNVVNSTNTYAVAETYTSTSPNSVPNHVRLYNSSDPVAELILISPPIDVAVNTLRTKFYAKGGTNYSLDVGTWDGSTFTLLENILIPSGYAMYSVNFSGYTGTDTRIAYRHGLGGTSRSIYMDDVMIEVPAPIAPEPATVLFPADGITTLLNPMLQWAPSMAGEPATSYKVYLNQGGAFSESDVIYEGTDLQYQTSGMDYGRSFSWKVLPLNVHGSDPTCPTWTFNTAQEDQLAEGFEVSVPPAGWANGSAGNWSRSTSSPLFEGTASAYKYTSTSNVYVLSTPLLTIDASSTIDFYTRASSTSQVLQMVYSDDRDVWTPIGTAITYAATGIWYPISINLSTLAGNYYIGFQTPTQTSSGSIYVDHVIGPDLTPVLPGTPILSTPADAALDQSRYPNLTWSAPTTGGATASYNVYLDTVDGSTLIGSSLTNSYAVETPLDWEATYYWSVAAVNNAGIGEASVVRSFTVMSDPTIYDLPWLEDFGTVTGDWPVQNWTQLSGLYPTPTGTTTQWYRGDWIYGPAGNNAPRINIYGTSRYGWLVTPPIAIPADGHELKFDVGLTKWNSSVPILDNTSQEDDKFIVIVSDSPNMTNPTILREWNNAGSEYVFNNILHTGESVTIDLTGYSGAKHFAFYGESTVNGGDNALFVDNVMVRESPTGPPDPVTLISPEDEAAEQPIDGFDLTWSAAVTGGNPDSYAIFMSQTEANLYSDYYWDNITLTRFDPTQAEINPLTYNYSGTWYWTVQALNGDGDAYQETPFSFTIMDDPRILSLPYSQNFDGVTAPAMPAEWTGYVNSTNTYATAETYSSTTYAVSAPNSVKLYNSSDTAADLRIVTPEITVPMNSIKLSFYARISSTSETLLVGTVDTPEGTFTQLASIDLTTTQTPYTVSLADYVGTDQYICFKHGVTSTSKTIYIDDVQMDQLAANDMAVVSLTGLPYGFENTEVTHTVTVKNNGTSTQNSYTVYLKSVDNRIVLASEIINEELLPDATRAVDLSWTTSSLGALDIYGEVVLAGDTVPVNNVSEIMTFNTYEEGILFESFEGGIIPSNWTVLNEDGDTRTWEAATTYPNTGEYAASCRYGDSSSTDNDDWLITPPLQLSSSVADQISFWIGKSSTSTSYTEDWEVLLSSTNTDPSSFTMIDSGTIPDIGYIQKSYDLDTYFSGDAVVYLALRYRGTWDWYLHADDFVGPPIYVPTSLPQPVLTVSTSGSNVVLDWEAIPYARSYQIEAADAPEGPYTLLTTVAGNTYSTPATSKKFFKVTASTEGIRTITQQPLSLEQQLLKDEADRVSNGKE